EPGPPLPGALEHVGQLQGLGADDVGRHARQLRGHEVMKSLDVAVQGLDHDVGRTEGYADEAHVRQLRQRASDVVNGAGAGPYRCDRARVDTQGERVPYRRDPDESRIGQPVDARPDRGLRHREVTGDVAVRAPAVLLEGHDDALVQVVYAQVSPPVLAWALTVPKAHAEPLASSMSSRESIL